VNVRDDSRARGVVRCTGGCPGAREVGSGDIHKVLPQATEEIRKRKR
jgi:hypothetical protein